MWLLSSDRQGGWRVRTTTFGLLFLGLAVWGVALPRFAAPDENRHVVKAWAVAHADRGRVDADGVRRYTVPGYLDETPPCYTLMPTVPASCLGPADGPSHETVSGAANYPPAYYLLVGAPALVASGDTMLVLMRLVSAAWVALFLALAVGSLARLPRREPYLPALLIVLGPVTFFLGATVNPSGLSIATALAVWSAGLALLRHPPDVRFARGIDVVGLSMCLFLLLRRDSVLWAALMVVALALSSRPDTRRALLGARRAWLWAAGTGASAVFQFTTSGAESASASFIDATVDSRTAIRELPDLLGQMLGGRLGWLDTPLPRTVHLLFDGVLVVLLVAALAAGRVRLVVMMVGTIAVALAVPTALRAATGYGLQGRYVLPLAMGVPLLAGAALAERRWPGRWPPAIGPVLAAAFAVAQVASFAWVIRRFTAGVGGPWWFDQAPSWEPALPASVLVVLVLLVFGLTFAWLAWRFRRAPAPEIDELAAIDLRDRAFAPALDRGA